MISSLFIFFFQRCFHVSIPQGTEIALDEIASVAPTVGIRRLEFKVPVE